MIHYEQGGRYHILNLFKLRGSLFPVSFLVALPATLFAGILKFYGQVAPTDIFNDNTAWSGFTFLVGFLVIFRTSQAYSKFGDGCRSTHAMRAEWIDAACALCAFCKASTAERDDVLKFKHLVVRLFSLLHTMALGDIEECQDWDRVMALNFELIDPNGLDQESWLALTRCENKVELVFQWIQTVIVSHTKTGVLSIPPPILSRVFQELANGMIHFHDASRIATIPFPFPYAQVCDILLLIHWVLTPLVTAQSTTQVVWCIILTFVQIFILQSLNNIAVEIEHPFGSDANDLDTAAMQLDMNMSLLLLLHPAADRAPTLSDDAVIHGLVPLGRQASQSMCALQPIRTDAWEPPRSAKNFAGFWESASRACLMEVDSLPTLDVQYQPTFNSSEQTLSQITSVGSAVLPSLAPKAAETSSLGRYASDNQEGNSTPNEGSIPRTASRTSLRSAEEVRYVNHLVITATGHSTDIQAPLDEDNPTSPSLQAPKVSDSRIRCSPSLRSPSKIEPPGLEPSSTQRSQEAEGAALSRNSIETQIMAVSRVREAALKEEALHSTGRGELFAYSEL